jgi:hypothetical protein
MNYVNLHVTCEKKYRSSPSIIKKFMKNSVMYENRENKKIEEVKPYIQICVFNFHSTRLYLVLSPANYGRSWPSPGPGQPQLPSSLPCHGPGRPQPPMPCSRCALAAPRPRPAVPPMPHSGCALAAPRPRAAM